MAKQPARASATVAEAALAYAARGWRVLPLRGKIPLVRDWTTAATTDADAIHGWFHEHPEANVGIATGSASGIFVIDVDGDQGEASLADLEATYGKLPPTYEVETSRGRHLYFTQPAGMRTKSQASGELGLKLDVRGDGGQVVAPPSLHPETKKQYRRSTTFEPAAAPRWLLDLINAARRRASPADVLIPEKIPVGRRNSEMTRIAGILRRQGFALEEMLGCMLEVNRLRMQPLKDDEVRTIAASIAKKDPARILIDGRLNDQEFIVASASEGKDMPTTWRWPLFLPRGMLVGWGGDPGLGKSTMAYTVAAAVSTGARLPGDDGEEAYLPANVVILSGEDDRAKTIKPRLRLAGAEMARCKIVSALTNAAQPVSFPQHLQQLAELIRENRAELAVIDPLDAFLGEEVDSHKNADVRKSIMPLAQIAESTDATILILGHLNKAAASSVIYRFGGSIAFVAAPRACFVFAPSEDGAEGHNIFACVKMNVARRPKALKYEIVEEQVAGLGGVARVKWLGESEETAESTLSPNGSGRDAALREAKAFLLEALKDGPRPSKEVEDECLAESICKRRTLTAARREVTTARPLGRKWYVALKGYDWGAWQREPGED